MAYPSFSLSGGPILTFSRGSVFPTRHTYAPRQLVGHSEAGTVRVATLSDPEEVLVIVFQRLPAADYTNLLAFFQDSRINWGATAFTFTDETGATVTVRYLEPLDMPQVNAGLYDVTLSLRVEIVP